MDERLLYIRCPHCHKGWFTKIIEVICSKCSPNGPVLKIISVIVEGINPTDLMKPIRCLNCGHYYTPIRGGLIDPKHGWEKLDIDWECGFIHTDDWVAERVMNTKGN